MVICCHFEIWLNYLWILIHFWIRHLSGLSQMFLFMMRQQNLWGLTRNSHRANNSIHLTGEEKEMLDYPQVPGRKCELTWVLLGDIASCPLKVRRKTEPMAVLFRWDIAVLLPGHWQFPCNHSSNVLLLYPLFIPNKLFFWRNIHPLQIVHSIVLTVCPVGRWSTMCM